MVVASVARNSIRCSQSRGFLAGAVVEHPIDHAGRLDHGIDAVPIDQQVGHPVLKLKRLALGPLRLGRLARGRYRPLTAAELAAVKAEVGLK